MYKMLPLKSTASNQLYFNDMYQNCLTMLTMLKLFKSHILIADFHLHHFVEYHSAV